MINILIKRTDGGVSVMEVTDKSFVATAIRKWKDVKPGQYISHETVQPSNIPDDRTFRNAWTHDLSVDMDLARDIHMDNIRKPRDKRLKQLDQRQYGPEYDDERQALRDIPQTFDLTQATTPEELKALWPDELKEK